MAEHSRSMTGQGRVDPKLATSLCGQRCTTFSSRAKVAFYPIQRRWGDLSWPVIVGWISEIWRPEPFVLCSRRGFPLMDSRRSAHRGWLRGSG
jgi:hypothetical protein